MKDFAKSIRTKNGKVGNKFIPVKKKDGYYMPVEEGFYYKINGKRVGVEKINGKSLKLTDGTTISVDQIQDIDVSNSKPNVGNAKDKNGIELKVGDVVAVKTDDPKLNHGKIKRISGDQVSVDVTGDDDIWTTPARLVVKIGNSKIGNAKEVTIIAPNGEKVKAIDYDQWHYKCIDTGELVEKRYSKVVGNKGIGNSKVGNREISLSASNSGELNLYDDGTGFMYDPIELGRYDIEGKSDAMATVRELERLKRNAETKIKDCQKFIDTLKQWANGLK